MFDVNEKIRFIEGIFGPSKHSMEGIAIRCPSCKHENKTKLSIRLLDDAHHCWSCGLAGKSLLPLIAKYGDRSNLQEYKQKFYQGKPFADSAEYASPEVEVKPELPGDFKLLALSRDAIDPDAKVALRYLEKRGMTDRELWYFKFGISSTHKRRILFPSFDSAGSLNFLTARAIDDDAWMKYQNSKNSRKAIVFNELNIDWSKPLTLVEGPFDLTKCNENATCLMGSALAADSRLMIQVRTHKTPVLLALDDDAQARVHKIATCLAKHDIDVKLVDLGRFHDPGEMTRDEFERSLAAAKLYGWNERMAYKISGLSCSFKI